MMKKVPLYSRARHVAGPADERDGERPGPALPAGSATGDTAGVAGSAAVAGRWQRLRARLLRHERLLWALLLLTAAALWFQPLSAPSHPALTFKQIDAAMRKSIAINPLPSAAARAYATVFPSVVRVSALMSEDTPGGQEHGTIESGVGTGVVIIENGTILTNLHVVAGARRIEVTFFDGSQSPATIVNVQPENDLAVLRARVVPDDLQPATMRSTTDLAPGDQVLAVGFPFGIGPSATAGVVSGLKREFRSPEGKQMLTNLIQFDAAANPGNSGGPLVTMDGEVVGIVTAILNPSHQRVFVGIGFAVPIENAATAAGLPPF